MQTGEKEGEQPYRGSKRNQSSISIELSFCALTLKCLRKFIWTNEDFLKVNSFADTINCAFILCLCLYRAELDFMKANLLADSG